MATMKELKGAYETSKTPPDYAVWAEAWKQENPGVPVPNETQFLKMFPAENKGSNSLVDIPPKSDGTAHKVSGAGKMGAAMGGVSTIADIISLGGAGERQEETVGAYKDLANLTGEAVDIDKSAVNLATLNARDDSEESASTLTTLLESGLDASTAAAIVAKQKSGQTSELLKQLNTYGAQKQTADEAAKNRRTQFDAIATQVGLPIDKAAGWSDIATTAGQNLLGAEALFNPTGVTDARSGRTLKFEHGGDLQVTPGASDHSENPLMVTNKDGSPATDEAGKQMELTGKETILPDWLLEQLLAAYKKGPKELKKVFEDEIVEEERFNENIA